MTTLRLKKRLTEIIKSDTCLVYLWAPLLALIIMWYMPVGWLIMIAATFYDKELRKDGWPYWMILAYCIVATIQVQINFQVNTPLD